jgi:hypothetical protein
LHTLTNWALDNAVVIEGLEIIRPSLEDIYLQLTGGVTAQDPDLPVDPVAEGSR